MMAWIHSPAGSLAIAGCATAMLAWECGRSRWSPFFLIHAVFSIAFPIAAGAWPRGNPAAPFARAWAPCLLFAALLAAWEIGFAGHAYEVRLLKHLGKDQDPWFSPARALDGILARAAARLGISPGAAAAVFGAYAILWAPLGEDLFLWGYLHATLSPSWGFWPATLGIAVLFAGHHLFYLGGLWDQRPWGSLAAFAVTGLVSGVLMSLLFRAAGSLYPLMAAHAGVNLAWVALTRSRPSQSTPAMEN